jgi:hypothetical protein
MAKKMNENEVLDPLLREEAKANLKERETQKRSTVIQLSVTLRKIHQSIYYFHEARDFRIYFQPSQL